MKSFFSRLKLTCINSRRMPQQLLGTTPGQYSTSTRMPLNTPPTVTLPSFTKKSLISNLSEGRPKSIYALVAYCIWLILFYLGPLLSTVVFFLYTLVNFSISRSKSVSEVKVTVFPLASRIENTVAGHSELCRMYLKKTT